MTTYPLSEPATIHATEGPDDATAEVLGRGSLEDCAAIVAGLPSDLQGTVSIRMDELDMKFGAQEIAELLQFLRAEGDGLSNNEITDIKSTDA